MDPRSEVLIRNIELFDGHIVLAGAPADDLLAELPQAYGWSWHAGEYAVLKQRFAERCDFSTELASAEYTSGVLFLPKSRELTEYLLHELAAKIPSDWFFLVGERRAGVGRVGCQRAE